MPREKLSVELSSYAKINLFLDIVGIREDGYHLLQMVNAQISLHDTIRCTLILKPQIVVSCNDSSLAVDESNTAYRAAARFREQSRFFKGIMIHLEKRIPMGAGLGGGSSNAASVLRALNQLTYDRIPLSALQEIARGLGADVPFFLESGICLCSGIGEKVIPIPTRTSPEEIPLYGVLCSPDQHVSTQIAYRLWDQLKRPIHSSAHPLINALMENDWEKVPSAMFNAFEPVIFEEYPEIGKAYAMFESLSPTAPRMTGSGSNLFSLHTDKNEAEEVARKLNEKGLRSTEFHLML